ncbi:MAG: SH3 domain-containing protein [Oscillatoria princeps RMCB-10]|nr:SH3 domain-containing protein [Oscillatoria princeps RMCB-10]
MGNPTPATNASRHRQHSVRLPAAAANHTQLHHFFMKDSQKREISFNSLWLKTASMACLLSLLSIACSPQPPAAESPAGTSQTVPVPAAPASTPLAAQAQASQPELCKVTMVKIADPNPPTNVRSSPEVKPNNIVGKVENGKLVPVKTEKNGWFEISEPAGWISKKVTESGCNQKRLRISFAPNSSSVIISDRFIGTGSHEYLLKANQGQTLTVTANKGSLPFIFAPGDKNRKQDLGGGGDYSGKKSWTGKLPATGDYLLNLDSNFKGYDYSFTVEVK